MDVAEVVAGAAVGVLERLFRSEVWKPVVATERELGVAKWRLEDWRLLLRVVS